MIWCFCSATSFLCIFLMVEQQCRFLGWAVHSLLHHMLWEDDKLQCTPFPCAISDKIRTKAVLWYCPLPREHPVAFKSRQSKRYGKQEHWQSSVLHIPMSFWICIGVPVAMCTYTSVQKPQPCCSVSRYFLPAAFLRTGVTDVISVLMSLVCLDRKEDS